MFIGPFCIIEKAEIGDNSIIHGNCVIGDNVLIGKNVMIHHHTLIGSDGFGFVRNSEKKLEKFQLKKIRQFFSSSFFLENNITFITKKTKAKTTLKPLSLKKSQPNFEWKGVMINLFRI